MTVARQIWLNAYQNTHLWVDNIDLLVAERHNDHATIRGVCICLTYGCLRDSSKYRLTVVILAGIESVDRHFQANRMTRINR
jgi:hypothetical protein